MKSVPQNCKRCGAPIEWDGASSYIICNYCDKKNYLGEANFKEKRFNLVFNQKLLIYILTFTFLSVAAITYFNKKK